VIIFCGFLLVLRSGCSLATLKALPLNTGLPRTLLTGVLEVTLEVWLLKADCLRLIGVCFETDAELTVGIFDLGELSV